MDFPVDRLRDAPDSKQPATNSRVLVVGSTGFAGVKCIQWFSGSVPNVAEFDAVVINAVSLANVIGLRDDEQSKPFSEIKRWQGWLEEMKRGLKKLLSAGGRVYAIVPKRTLSVGLKDNEPVKGWPSFVSTSDWIPLPTEMADLAGETLNVRDEAFSRYFAHVRRWTYVFADTGIEQDEDSPDWYIYQSPLATNKAGEAVAVRISYVLPRFREGLVFLLPPPTEGTTEEGVRIILEDRCGIQAPAPDPHWFSQLTIPGETEARVRCDKAQVALLTTQDEVRAAEAALKAVTYYKRLLNQTGTPLEEVVRKTFETMGLKTKDSEVADFILADGEDVLVEVKGRSSAIPTSDVSQLIKDIGNLGTNTGRVLKGLLVGNAWKDSPPDQRDSKEQPIFPDDAIQTARNHSIALLSTVELFNAYSAVKDGKLSADEVMQRILDTTGIATLAE